jgi:hypothetical protein
MGAENLAPHGVRSQPVASRYTDYAISGATKIYNGQFNRNLCTYSRLVKLEQQRRRRKLYMNTYTHFYPHPLHNSLYMKIYTHFYAHLLHNSLYMKIYTHFYAHLLHNSLYMKIYTHFYAHLLHNSLCMKIYTHFYAHLLHNSLYMMKRASMHSPYIIHRISVRAKTLANRTSREKWNTFNWQFTPSVRLAVFEIIKLREPMR